MQLVVCLEIQMPKNEMYFYCVKTNCTYSEWVLFGDWEEQKAYLVEVESRPLEPAQRASIEEAAVFAVYSYAEQHPVLTEK